LDIRHRPVADPADAKIGKPRCGGCARLHHDVDRLRAGRAERPDQLLVNKAWREVARRASVCVGLGALCCSIQERDVRGGIGRLKEQVGAGVDEQRDA